jgi:hypothetical protein
MTHVYATREEFEQDLARIRALPEMQAIAVRHRADMLAMMHRRARRSPEELARIDAETERQIAAWSRGDLT